MTFVAITTILVVAAAIGLSRLLADVYAKHESLFEDLLGLAMVVLMLSTAAYVFVAFVNLVATATLTMPQAFGWWLVLNLAAQTPVWSMVLINKRR